jgi:hypothetical protein
MKKLTKLHAALIILLIAALAATAYFSFSYRGVEAKQPDIQNEINLALMRLKVVQEENDPTLLKIQLDELQSEINLMNRDEPLFPKRPPSVEIGDLIIDSVEKLQLSLLKLSPQDEAGTVTIKSDVDSEGNKYSKAEYEVKVKGGIGRINSLIGEIEAAGFATLTIENLEIEFKEEEEGERTIE